MKRIICVLLALLMIFTLVGCGKKKRQIIKLTLSTEDSEAILAAAGIRLPDAADTAASGSTIKWFAWYDGFHNYAEDEIVNTGFFTFTEKYGCEIEWLECTWDKRFDDLANLILGGTPPDFYPGNSETFPNYAIKGMFAPVDDYVDYDDPLWNAMKGFADTYFNLGGKHYMICTDSSFGTVCAYNRRVMDEWGYDDPAELYFNDEWTWDIFYEMCVDFSDPDEDRYALDSWAYSEAIMDSSGATVVNLDTESGKFVSNLDDPRLERASNMLYDLAKNECIYPVWNHNWNTRNGTDNEGAGIKEGLCLFYIRGPWAFTGPVDEISNVWGDVLENELMFVPMPRDPNGDGKYYMSVKAAGYCIVNGAENAEGVALFASCERFKILDPTVVSIDRRQLEEKYLWTQEMLNMYDTCKAIAQNGDTATVYYGNGLGDNLWQTNESLKSSARQSATNAQSWAQTKESNADTLQYYVDELNLNMEEFVANGGVALD